VSDPCARSTGAATGAAVALRLGVLAVAAGTPFCFAGLATAAVLSRAAARVHAPYAATLLGSALGCLLAPLLLDRLSAPAALAAAACLGFAGARDLAADRSLRRGALALAALALAAAAAVEGTGAAEIPFARGVYDSNLLAVRWNAMSRVAAFRLPASELSRAFGVSRTYGGPVPAQLGLVVDDFGYTSLFEGRESRATPEYFRSNLVALAYHLRPGARALILGPGGGKDLWIALSFPDTTVTAVEINPQVVEMVEETFATFTGRPYSDPRVTLAVADGRRFAATDLSRYDLVGAATVSGRLPPAAGAFTLAEDPLHTVEAFRDYWRRLTPRGLLSVSRLGYEQRALRLAALSRALLEAEGVERPGDHVRVLGDRGFVNVLVGRAPFAPDDDVLLRQLARDQGFSFLYPAPGAESALSRVLDAPELEPVLASLPFDVSPPTDDRPFFYYTLRPGDFFGGRPAGRAGFDARGAELLRAAFLVIAGLTAAGLLAPLAIAAGRPPAGARPVLALVYAALLGVGYMALQIGTMKRLSLFLGHPVYGASATLFAFLLGGGAGSLWARRLAPTRTPLCWVLAGAAVLGGAQTFLLPTLLASVQDLPAAGRYAVAAGALLPLAFVLGIPMPAALALAAGSWRSFVPWGWAANCAGGVLGSLGALLCAMNFGYTATLSAGAGLYAVAIAFARALPREGP
ncbi:MAG: hypothetical protein ACYDA8_21760, partial [Deferrisomatales bacterium]